MLKPFIAMVISGQDLSFSEAQEAMALVMSGQATPAQIAGLLVGLRMKGETVDEMAGGAMAMRDAARRIRVDDPNAIDTCGTGGDGKGLFNVSTLAALIVAGAGVKVAKHGNRAASGATGSADVLAVLGLDLNIPSEGVEACIREANIGFLFAPMLHEAMRHAIGPRRELGVRTIFNVLGPLTNPAGVKRQVIGVFDGALLFKMASALKLLGAERAMIVHSEDGLDEISLSAPTRVVELLDGGLTEYMINPMELGLKAAPAECLRAENVGQSVKIIKGVLGGEDAPARHIAALNAAAALRVAGVADELAAGLKLAYESIDSGAAARALDIMIRTSRSFRKADD